MTTRHTLRTAISTIGCPLLAASLLAGCADPTPNLMAAGITQARADVAQAAPTTSSEALPSLAPQRCDANPAGEMQLRIMREQAFVPLMVNNTKLNLLLDTGDFVTALTPEAVTRLALPPSPQQSLQMTGIGGAYQAPIVQAADVQYLSHHLANLPFAVLPDAEFRPNEKTDGLFGANFLSAFQVELDFPGKRLRFYEHAAGCAAAAPAWTATATRLPAIDAGHQLLLIPVRVNGVELNALIDTGSEDTSISKEAAERLGITAAAMKGDDQIIEEGLGESSERLHRFASITVGGATFANPVLAVDDAPSPLQANIETASRSALPTGHLSIDVILGANYLFKTKLFLDYRNSAVYIQ